MHIILYVSTLIQRKFVIHWYWDNELYSTHILWFHIILLVPTFIPQH